jgi:hypothetical protein
MGFILYNLTGLSSRSCVETLSNIESAIATFRPREGFIPNPKLKLREQVHEIMWLKQFYPQMMQKKHFLKQVPFPVP